MRWHSTAELWHLVYAAWARLPDQNACRQPQPVIRPRCVLSGLSVFTVTATINDVRARLGTLEPALEAFQAWRLGIDFLAKQCQRPEFTPRHYKVACPILETMREKQRLVKRSQEQVF